MTSSTGDIAYDEGMGRNITQLKERMKPFLGKGLKIKAEVTEDSGHYEIVVPALWSALNMIYPPELWEASFNQWIKKSGNALANIDAHYNSLSKVYGFKIMPMAERWNNANSLSRAARRLLEDGRLDEAQEVCERWIQYRPQTAWGRHQLAKILAAKKKIKEAMVIQKKAIALADENLDVATRAAHSLEQLQQ